MPKNSNPNAPQTNLGWKVGVCVFFSVDVRRGQVLAVPSVAESFVPRIHRPLSVPFAAWKVHTNPSRSSGSEFSPSAFGRSKASKAGPVSLALSSSRAARRMSCDAYITSGAQWSALVGASPRCSQDAIKPNGLPPFGCPDVAAVPPRALTVRVRTQAPCSGLEHVAWKAFLEAKYTTLPQVKFTAACPLPRRSIGARGCRGG